MKRFLIAATVIATLLTASAATRAQAPVVPPAAPAPAPDSPAKTASVDGKWHFVLDTQGGDREIEAEFAVDSNGKVTGTFGKAAVAGTFMNGKLDLSFDFTSEEVGTTAPMIIKGKLDDSGALSGSWQFADYDGSFTASHPKA
jgi:opacity protein-like surface antigen